MERFTTTRWKYNMNRSRELTTKKKGRSDEINLLGRALRRYWGARSVWRMAREDDNREKQYDSNLLIHVATVVFGAVTGKGDDMICPRQD